MCDRYDLYVKANAQCKVEDDPIDEEVTEMTSACIEFTPKQKAREYFAKMEAGDEKALALWKEFRDLSIIEYKRIYGKTNASEVYIGLVTIVVCSSFGRFVWYFQRRISSNKKSFWMFFWTKYIPIVIRFPKEWKLLLKLWKTKNS